MAALAIPEGWEVVDPPRASVPAGWEVVEPEFDVLDGAEALEAVRSLGPGAELEYLDGKDGRFEELDFDEWKRREELIGGLGFWDRHVARNVAAAGAALGGLWDTVKRAAGEVRDLSLDVPAGQVSRVAVPGRLAATAAEAALAGAVDFTDLVEAVGTTVLDTGIEAAIGGTQEEKQKVDYARYRERFAARKERADLGRESMLGSAVGGLATAAGAPRAGIAAQHRIRGSVMPATAEIGAMLSPTNPLNVVPFGAGRAAGRLGVGVARAGSVTAGRMARAADRLQRVTEIGALTEQAVMKVAPSLSAAEAARWGRLMRGAAWTATGAGVTGIGLGEDSDLRLLASLYGASRIGLRTVSEAGQFAAAVGRQAAEGPRFQSVLKRVTRDPAVPKWAAQTAKVLDDMGASRAAFLARGVGAGAAVGGGLNVGLTALSGADETEVAGAAAVGAVIGAGFGGAGAVHSKLSGADAALRADTERMLLAEAHREIGGDEAAQFFYDLPPEAQLAAGMVQAIAGPTAQVRILPRAEFEKATGGTGAGVFIEPRSATDVARILINGDAVRPPGQTALHEFAHMLAMRRAPGEIKALYDEFATPDERAQAGNDYVAAFVRGRRSDPEYAGLNDAEAMARGRADLTRENPDWEVQEWFAEKGVQALYGQRWKDIAAKGERADVIRLADLTLRSKRAVLENAGVAFDADGTVRDPEMLSSSFRGQGDAALAKIVFGYVKDIADYSPVIDSVVRSQAAADAGRGPAIDFGRNYERALSHPAFKNTWERNPATGLDENEFAVKMPDGTIVLKDPKRVNAAEAQREADIAALFPPDAPKLDSQDALVGRRDGAQGEEISGQVLPAAFDKSAAFTDRQKATARTIQDTMMRPEGETLEHWYHQIGSGGSSARWAAAVRAKLGNVRATFREIRPINFVVTKANNLIARVVDVTALKAKLLDEVRAGRLTHWANNAESFHRDLHALFANWSQGLPGETGIGTAKHQALLDFLGKDGERNSLIKSFRVDRMEDVQPTGRTGWTFDYGKFKRRESPEVRKEADDQAAGGGSGEDRALADLRRRFEERAAFVRENRRDALSSFGLQAIEALEAAEGPGGIRYAPARKWVADQLGAVWRAIAHGNPRIETLSKAAPFYRADWETHGADYMQAARLVSNATLTAIKDREIFWSPDIDDPDFVARPSDEHDALRVGTAYQGLRNPTTPATNVSMETVDPKRLASQMNGFTLIDGPTRAMPNAPVVRLPESIRSQRSPRKRAEAYIEWARENLIALHNAFPEEARSRATHWYDGARRVAGRMADAHGLSIQQAGGILAVLSPNKDWFQNVKLAQNVADVVTNHLDEKIGSDPAHAEVMERIIERTTAGTPATTAAEVERRMAIFREMEGKSLRELWLEGRKTGHINPAAWATRVLSLARHGDGYELLTPEGRVEGKATTRKGDDQRIIWQSGNAIAKALSIAFDGAAENISTQLGQEHKVRSFYNNIVAPSSPMHDVTIDTHAVAAATLFPVGPESLIAGLNFDEGGVAGGGNRGIYWLNREAYVRAANELGIQPRQLQSITWEAVRGLFPRASKQYLRSQIRNILASSGYGPAARQGILARGIGIPSWARP